MSNFKKIANAFSILAAMAEVSTRSLAKPAPMVSVPAKQRRSILNEVHRRHTRQFVLFCFVFVIKKLISKSW